MVTLFRDHGFLSARLAEVLTNVRSAIDSVEDSQAIGRDRDQWVDELVRAAEVQAPTPEGDGSPQIEDLGRQVRDVTGQAGISYTLTERGNVRRETVNYRVAIRFSGETALLLCAPEGGAAYTPADALRGERVEQGFYYVLGEESSTQFEMELQQWTAAVLDGADRVARQVERFNAGLPEAVGKLVDEHIAKVTAAAEFTASLPFAVVRREDAPPRVATPPIKSLHREIPSAGEIPSDQPTLGRYFDAILGVLESATRALERTPGRYGDWDEESLRDAMLVHLNAQFKGIAHGEAFNASGKTDILIHVEDNNLFIGECKIWGGPKQLDGAIDQLLGYSTWRDSRLALLVFVKTRDIAQVAQRSRKVLELRSEFEHWLVGAEGKKARIRWTDDRARTATIALLLCHLAPG